MSWFDDNEDYVIFGSHHGFARKKRRRTSNTFCKYCGEDRLKWVDTEKGWRLFTEQGEQHLCEKKEIDNEFEDLTKEKEKTMTKIQNNAA
jgi:hypothetical protein